MVATSRTWYNGSNTMAAKPIKTLELYYTMIQFLVMADIPWVLSLPRRRFLGDLYYFLSKTDCVEG